MLRSLCDLPSPVRASGWSRLLLAGSGLLVGERLRHGAALKLDATELLRCLSSASSLLFSTAVQKSAIAAGSVVAGSSACVLGAAVAFAAAALLLLPRVLRLAPSGLEAVAAKQPVPGAGATRTWHCVSPSGSTCSDLPCERGVQASMDFPVQERTGLTVVFIAFKLQAVTTGNLN